MKAKLEKLEMLRGFAAFYVFAGHFLIERLFTKGSWVCYPFRFGQEAVMLFFIISGFVVYYSTAKHGDSSFWPYLVRRARRILPIYFIALAITFAVVFLFGHEEFSGKSLRDLIGNIFMLQDFRGGKPGVWFSAFGANRPLWSLSYEWWFYMMFFPIYRYVAPAHQLHVAAGISFVGFVTYNLWPNQAALFLMYFILWWSGAELGRAYLLGAPLNLSSQRRSILYLAFFTLLASGPILLALFRGQSLSFGIHPVLELRHFLACLLILVGGLLWARARWRGFRLVFGAFAVFAPISYALYVFHYPLLVRASFLERLPLPVQFIGYITIIFILAYLAEVPFQKWINRKTEALTRHEPMAD